MLSAPARPEATEVIAPRARRVVIRRRRVVTALMTMVAGFGLLGFLPSLSAMRWGAAGCGLLTAGYLALVAHIRHLQASREMALAFGPAGALELDWAELERELGMQDAVDDRAPIAMPVEIGNKEVARFLISYAIGWLLTPVVMAIRLVRGDPALMENNGVIGRIVWLQQHGRSQSLRILTVGAAATVGITAVSGVTAGAVTSSRVTATAPAGAAYTVQPGDTLSAIAARHGSTVAAIAAANRIADPNLILVGQVLTIAGAGPVPNPGAAATSGSYTVERGDTLSAIAARDGSTVAAIAAANHIADPNLILVDEVLTVATADRPVPNSGEMPITSKPQLTAGTGGTYRVRAGDTLGSIAASHGTNVAAIAAASDLADTNLIVAGQVLALPGAAQATPAAAPTPVRTSAHAPAPRHPSPHVPAPVAHPPVTPAKVAAPVAHPPAHAPAAAPTSPTSAPAAHPPAPPVAATVASATSGGGLPLPAQYLHGGSVDQGVDYTAPGGTPLYAMGDGVIIREGMDGFGPGTPCLQITSGPLAGKAVYYGHAGADLVPVGAHVVKGQQISVVGYGIVGISSGPHVEVGFYPPGGSGSGQAMLNYINSVVGYSTGG